MKKIYLVRHGQSLSNAGLAIMPNATIPLTALGQTQAEQVADWLMEEINEPIQQILVSTFLRTQQTAQPFANKIAKTPIMIDNLQEFDYLMFNRVKNLPINELPILADEYWLTFSPDQIDGIGAESFSQFCQRVNKVQTFFNELPTGNYVAFTHGLWISMLIWQMLQQPTNNQQAMQKFRQFELSIRANNCDVFLLTIPTNSPASIQKVRTT